MQKNSKFSTRQIAYAAMFIALGIIVNSLRIGSFLSFGGFPIILSGYALGPVMGFIIGAITDVLAYIVRPSATGGFNPVFILTSALTGAIPVIVTQMLGDKYPEFKLWKIIVGIVVGQFTTSVFMVPYFISILYGKHLFIPSMIKAAIKQSYSAPLYGLLVKIIFNSLKNKFKLRETA
ncbi:folate family ECF transporter S component [Anaerosphaera multitolerans]|uniref:Folate family ECF transporter S component n=1 Tax=Anaerosphaera multitolerans TaxID=2487351 RepID=A0A437S9G4_9FIRM|nr:folate family ECF transporter S component [Anaerosphaera multitolerans]RVU55457.1 folate family ECF transporter S component [Anaerosphaera multitolerans]